MLRKTKLRPDLTQDRADEVLLPKNRQNSEKRERFENLSDKFR